MKVAYSLAFRTLEQAQDELEGMELPLEIATYNLGSDALRQAKDFAKSVPGRVISYHGPSVPLNDAFSGDLHRGADLANAFGVKAMILHPHRVKGSDEAERLREQEKTIQLLDDLKQRSGCTPILETFGGRNRVLTPDEIIQRGFQMDLDTSHLSAVDNHYRLITNPSQIATVHLSEHNRLPYTTPHGHFPISVECESLLETMLQKSWNGIVALEYLPQFGMELRAHSRYMHDVVAGVAASHEGNLDAAESFFRSARSHNPDGYLAAYGLGMTLVRKKAYASAIRHLEDSKSTNSAHADTFLFLHYAHAALGNTAESVRFMTRCKQIDPSKEASLINIE